MSFCEKCDKNIKWPERRIKILAKGSPFPGTQGAIISLCIDCFKDLLEFLDINNEVLRDMLEDDFEDKIRNFDIETRESIVRGFANRAGYKLIPKS